MATKPKSKSIGTPLPMECQELLVKVIPTLEPVKLNASLRPSK